MPVARAGLAAALSVAAACSSSHGERVRVIDLLRQISTAETRPVSGRFEVTEHLCGDQPRASVAVPANSRVTWAVMLPDRAVVVTGAALTGPSGARAAFRVGVSDERIYEPLWLQAVSADACGRGWTPIEVDLGKYSGRKFSIFYRPSAKTWRIVLGVDVEAGNPERAHWAVPGIYTDISGAARFHRRR
jgi:hypothetical protein